MIAVRLLGPGDEDVLGVVTAALAAFGLDADEPAESGSEPLDAAGRGGFLADPAVRFWVAVDDDGPGIDVGGSHVVGELFCVIHPIPHQPGREVLLYDIGVHERRRREGIGRALLTELDRWAAGAGIGAIWVLAADDEASAFYAACGYAAPTDQPTYLERNVSRRRP